ncbi:MAG: hypothetical protein ACKVX7_08755 [Planctomycetota bacterium]
MRNTLWSAALMVTAIVCSCAAPGPFVSMPPTVSVSQFESCLITPELIRFQARVLIRNKMRGPLEIAKVEYGADLHDRPLFTETFDALHPMKSLGSQTVTTPIQIAMADILNQAEDVLAEEAIRVTYRGMVYPVGFEPIPFAATQVIPKPRIPEIAIDDVRGNPLDGECTVLLKVSNRNAFPIVFQSVETFLTLNGKKYDLLRTDSCSEIAARGVGQLAVTMRHTQGKALSVLINIARNQAANFTVGGSIACQTPYGLMRLPVELGSTGRETSAISHSE